MGFLTWIPLLPCGAVHMHHCPTGRSWNPLWYRSLRVRTGDLKDGLRAVSEGLREFATSFHPHEKCEALRAGFASAAFGVSRSFAGLMIACGCGLACVILIHPQKPRSHCRLGFSRCSLS